MMRSTTDNKMTTHAADGCACTDCRVRVAGLGPGPYTPEEYKLIAPPLLGAAAQGAATDPAVQRAQQAADALEAEYERAHDKWCAAVAEAQSATLIAKSAPMVITHDGQALYPSDIESKVDRGKELDEAAAGLRAERDRVHTRWRQAVAVRDDAVRRARWQRER